MPNWKYEDLGSDVSVQQIMERCDELGIDASTIKLDGHKEESYGEVYLSVEMSWPEA